MDDSGREDQFPGCFRQEVLASLVEGDQLVDMLRRNLGIGCDGKSDKSLLLDLPCADDFVPDAG